MTGEPEGMIIDAIMSAVTRGKIIGTQGTKRKRDVYEIDFNGTVQYISITVGVNGYIIGANPTRKITIQSLLQERQEEIAFEREGISLWKQLQKELGDEYEIVCFSQLQHRVVSHVDELAEIGILQKAEIA